MSVRVKIYKPVFGEHKEGKVITKTVENKKGKLIKSAAVSEQTLARFKNGGDDVIIQMNMYVEEDKNYKPKVKEEKPKAEKLPDENALEKQGKKK